MIKLLRKAAVRKGLQEEDTTEVIVEGNDYISHGSVTVTNTVIGDFYALKRIVVDAGACVTGNIVSTDAEIKGRVEGDIICRGCLSARATAVVTGGITAEAIEVEPGAIINGRITIEKRVPVPMLLEKVKQAARREHEVTDLSEKTDKSQSNHSTGRQEAGKLAPLHVPPSQPTAVYDTEGWW